MVLVGVKTRTEQSARKSKGCRGMNCVLRCKGVDA